MVSLDVCPTRIQISLNYRQVWSDSSPAVGFKVGFKGVKII